MAPETTQKFFMMYLSWSQYVQIVDMLGIKRLYWGFDEYMCAV